MLYYDKVNEELKRYFLTLCDNDYPMFIEKYLDTKPLKRIANVGQFCGCDYSKIFNVKYFYSRLDHSVACSLITWHFTKDKRKTLMALFHDLGTPCFSHTIDYLFGDSEKQESSEKDIFNVISASKEIMNLLNEDNITIDDLKDAYKCSIVENERPKICVDRLDGILGTALIWLSFWEIDDVKYIYKDLSILTNEEGNKEIGFNNINAAEYFYDAAYKYSMACQCSEDKYVMQFIADALKVLVENGIITLEDLYEKKEQELISLLEKNINCFNDFMNATKVERKEEKPDCYYVSKDAKRRYVIPLCRYKDDNYRLNDISSKVEEQTNYYLSYKDSLYTYVPSIKKIKLKESD